MIVNLDTSLVGASTVVLGGMFFQNFYGIFTNYYAETPVKQTATIYIGNDIAGLPYIGNGYLPVGINPWNPDPTLLVWQWALIGVAGLVILIIAVVLILNSCKRSDYERRESIA